MTTEEESAARERQALLGREPVPGDRTRRYGPHPAQLIDYHLPKGTERGRITVLHGGFWRASYDRAHLSPLAAELAGRGFAVALAEFRRVGGDGGWPGTFDDVATVLDTAWDGGAQLVVGHSSGGHLTLWAASRGRLPADSPWRSTAGRVSGAVAVAPVADLAGAAEAGLGDAAVTGLLGTPEEIAARLPQADPMRLLPADAPVTLVHGTADRIVPCEISRRYAAASGAQLVELPGTGHFAPVTPGTDAFAEVLAALGAG